MTFTFRWTTCAWFPGDRRDPSDNPNGLVYGAVQSDNVLAWVNPVDHTTREILGPRVRDVDCEVGSIVFQRGTSARARRMILLAGGPLSDVQRWEGENEFDPPDVLFPGVTIGGLRHARKRTRDAAGLEGVRSRDLRHTYAEGLVGRKACRYGTEAGDSN